MHPVTSLRLRISTVSLTSYLLFLNLLEIFFRKRLIFSTWSFQIQSQIQSASLFKTVVASNIQISTKFYINRILTRLSLLIPLSFTESANQLTRSDEMEEKSFLYGKVTARYINTKNAIRRNSWKTNVRHCGLRIYVFSSVSLQKNGTSPIQQ